MNSALAVFYASDNNKDLVAWLCLIIGIGLLIFGGVLANRVSKQQKELNDAKEKLASAQAALKQAREDAEVAKQTAPHPEGVAAADATTAATGAAEAATKTAIEQISGLLGSLPEAYRFPGLLLLVGTLLISVATVQFGGVSLF